MILPIHRSVSVKSGTEQHSGTGDPSGSRQRGTLNLISASFAFYLSAISFHDRELCRFKAHGIRQWYVICHGRKRGPVLLQSQWKLLVIFSCMERPSLPNSQNYLKLQMALKPLVLWLYGRAHRCARRGAFCFLWRLFQHCLHMTATTEAGELGTGNIEPKPYVRGLGYFRIFSIYNICPHSPLFASKLWRVRQSGIKRDG